MKKLITMLCLLLLLNGSPITAAAEQASAVNKLSEVTAALPAIDPDKINYKTELKKLGLLKEDSKDAALNLRNAVIRFQSSCNVAVNGKWDKKCLSMLAEQLRTCATGMTGMIGVAGSTGMTGVIACDDIVAAPPVAGKWITINKTKRILTLYEGDKAVQKYPVAIGNPPSRTPEGKYAIVSKVINPSWGGGGYAKPVKGGVPENPLGYRWLGLSYKNGSTLGIHGNNSPYSIGKNVSHGCIRMINSDVTQLFTIIPQSAPVWIGSEAKLKEWGVMQPEYGSKPVTPVKKATLPASDIDNGMAPDEDAAPAEITADPGTTAPTTDGAVKVTYDEVVPTTGGAIGLPGIETSPAAAEDTSIPANVTAP